MKKIKVNHEDWPKIYTRSNLGADISEKLNAVVYGTDPGDGMISLEYLVCGHIDCLGEYPTVILSFAYQNWVTNISLNFEHDHSDREANEAFSGAREFLDKAFVIKNKNTRR